MIYVKHDDYNAASFARKVGGYYLVPDSMRYKIPADVPVKVVDDGVKYPLGFRQVSHQHNSKNFFQSSEWGDFQVIAGPCAAENEAQIFSVAELISSLGIRFMRAGCFKPRTDAYSFQGLGRDGLQMCRNACDTYDLSFVTEVRDLSNLEDVMEYADIVQVGSKAMYDLGVLEKLGRSSIPVILKRHFGATLQEFAQHADKIAVYGNTNIALCERGIRTFEGSTRFTLDSCGIEWMKHNLIWPIIGDPSHAMGASYGVPGLSLAMVSQSVNGLLIEVHPSPKEAMSDANQQLTFSEFKNLYGNIKKFRNLGLNDAISE